MVDDQTRSGRTGEAEATSGLSGEPSDGPSAIEAPLLDTDDSTLAAKAFPGHRALCSETFMYVSRENYPLPWLVREIAQNFVDGNRNNPGSLDGVSVEEVATDGSSTFTFTGNWPFESFNDLVSFGSGKLDPQARPAGGNGIGIKQSILGFMRDFAVKRFVIVGEGWEVEYTMKSKDEINARLSALSSPHQAKHGVFMANVRRYENRGNCKYIIETDNRQVQEALREFRDLGVCAENKHLQDMHFRNEHGAIKWLPIEEIEDIPRYDDPPDAPQRTKLVAKKGRLFINGQIFRYARWNGEQADAKDYWRGPGGVTVQLKDIQYEMSIDRPPMEQWLLRRHIENFVRTMSRDELVANLQASEYLWTKLKYRRNYSDTPFCFTVIESIVERLESLEFSSDDYEEFFGGKHYLYADTELTETQIKDLEKEGYTICPDFFGKLHMPKASVKLSSIQIAAGKKPDIQEAIKACFKASSDAGLEVPYRKLDEESTPQAVASRIRDRLGNLVKSVIMQEDRKAVRIVLRRKIDKFRLIDMQDPPKETDVIGNLIYEIRGLAHIGLLKGFLQDIFMAQGQYVSTFRTNGEELYLRNNESPSDDTYIELILRDEDFAGFCHNLMASGSSGVQSVQKTAVLSRWNRFWKVAHVPAAVVSLVAVSVLATLLATSSDDEPDYHYADFPEGVSGKSSLTLGDIVRRQLRATIKPKTAPNTAPISNPVCEPPEPPDENVMHDIDDIEDYETVTPTASQLAQLELLKEYLFLTTGYKFPGKLHVFRGRGAYGVNRGNDIGMHEESLTVNFEDALATFAHEAAHDGAVGHEARFRLIIESLAAERENTLGNLARTPFDRRGKVAKQILAAEGKWNALKSKKTRSK